MKKLKSAEEYLEEECTRTLAESGNPWYENGIYDGRHDEILNAIKQAQIDAIEATAERCAEEAVFKITENALIEEGSLYDYYDDGVYTYRVDSDSILNVADKMKEELK